MIIVEKSPDTSGVVLKGDFFDLDRLYFTIFKFTGFCGIDDNCNFPGYDEICENLLGLCYEIRHARQGDRSIEQVYNGIDSKWFDDYIDNGNDYFEPTYRFSRKDFPDVTEKNTYFSLLLSFPEAVFYALIITELLEKKEYFYNAKKQLAKIKDNMQELNKEYYYFEADQDIARITLFAKQTLHTLYRFMGEKKYNIFFDTFKSKKDFFLNCDLTQLNDIIVDYAKKGHENDDPDCLFTTLISFFK
ncbi:MAG: hypothetical protein GYA02_06425 [Clostridiaceae bacterium]|jgi:hypothetical protein|nr:hypothetical protein [Clostridiaceae bacterium]